MLSIGNGERVHATYCIMATGCLSTTNTPRIEGLDSFAGPRYHTGTWPHQSVDFRGQRVGIIGTGSSAIQSIPVIAEQAEHLYVFQRTPNYAVPAHNHPLAPAVQAEIKKHYPEMRARAKKARNGVDHFPNPAAAVETPENRRREEFESRWATGGLGFLGAFADLIVDYEANEMAAEFIRSQILRGRRGPGSGASSHAAVHVRLQAAVRRHRLLRDVQPFERHPGRCRRFSNRTHHAGRAHRRRRVL